MDPLRGMKVSTVIFWVLMFSVDISLYEIAAVVGFVALIGGFIHLLQDPSDLTVWGKSNG